MLELGGVSKTYPGGQTAVQQLHLTVAEGETCMLVGPSGCGKTTTLRMINRMVEPSGGRILLDGQDLREIDPVDLRLRGYVIQQVGLFPHPLSTMLLHDTDRVRIRDRDEVLGVLTVGGLLRTAARHENGGDGA